MLHKNSLLFWLVSIFASGLVGVVSRIWFLLNNPGDINRINGSINWKFEILYGIVSFIISVFLGVSAIILLNYLEWIDDPMVVIVIGCSISTVSGEAFTILQNKVLKTLKKLDEKTDKVLNDEEI